MLLTAIALGLCGFLGNLGFLTGPVILAIAQGLALERYWTRSIPWGFATVIGGYLALGITFTMLALPLPLVIILSSAVLGAAQAFILRGTSRFWQWWPLVTVMVLLVSISWFLPRAIDAAIYGSQQTSWHWIAMTGLTGVIGGTFKGIALAWFLKQTPLPKGK